MLEGFEHRVDYIEPPALNKGDYLLDVLRSVRNGSHVYISSEANFNAVICPVNKEANRTVFRKDQFRRSRYVGNQMGSELINLNSRLHRNSTYR